jgi:hypothetical protein
MTLRRGRARPAYRIYADEEFLLDESLLGDCSGDGWLEHAGADFAAVDGLVATEELAAIGEGAPAAVLGGVDGSARPLGARGSIGGRSAGVAALAAAIAMVAAALIASELRSKVADSGRRDLAASADLGVAGNIPSLRPPSGKGSDSRVVLAGVRRDARARSILRLSSGDRPWIPKRSRPGTAPDHPRSRALVAGGRASASRSQALAAGGIAPASQSQAPPADVEGAPIARPVESLPTRRLADVDAGAAMARAASPEFGFER